MLGREKVLSVLDRVKLWWSGVVTKGYGATINAHRGRVLAAIIIAYLVLGTLYALLTPPWQVPDEPAHYNYVRYLATHGRLPVLQMGDYDQAYLSEITSRRFDPALSIDPIRYEFHQPPLYYVLLVPLYLAFGGALLPLRLFSVFIGGAVPLLAYAIGKSLFPRHAWLSLGTAAFVAFIPQHLAMVAGVENDVLAESLLGGILLSLVVWLQQEGVGSWWRLAGIGVLVGLGLLTKTTAYIALPLALLAVVLKAVHHRLGRRSAMLATVALMLPALLIGMPWFVRNALVYGGFDILGLRRHAQVVEGQLRTAEWIARHGWMALPGEFIRTTFRSFWAQFGWMAVPIDGRIYTALGVLSGAAALGFVFWLIDRQATGERASPAAVLLATSAMLTLVGYLGYNLSFYQAQGRYLFPALIPIGLAWTLGLRKVLERENALTIAALLALAAMLGGVRILTKTCGDKWRVLIDAVATAFFASGAMPGWLGELPFVVSYVLMAALCVVCPFWFIVPYLAP